jgi:hypothetical protein
MVPQVGTDRWAPCNNTPTPLLLLFLAADDFRMWLTDKLRLMEKTSLRGACAARGLKVLL